MECGVVCGSWTFSESDLEMDGGCEVARLVLWRSKEILAGLDQTGPDQTLRTKTCKPPVDRTEGAWPDDNGARGLAASSTALDHRRHQLRRTRPGHRACNRPAGL